MIPRRFFWLLDVLLLTAGFLVAYALAPQIRTLIVSAGGTGGAWVARHLSPPATMVAFPPITEFVWILLATAPSTVLLSELMGGYRRRNLTFVRTVISGAAGPLLSLGLVALGLLAIKEISWSRLFFFLNGGFAAALMVTCRLALLYWWHQRHAAGAYARNVVIIGTKSGLARLATLFQKRLVIMEYRLFGYMTLHSDELPLPASEVPYLGSASQLEELAVHQPIHEVMLVAGTHDETWLKKIVETCDYFRLSLRIIPETLLANAPKDIKSPDTDDPLHMPAIVLQPHLADTDMLFVKRLLDILVSGVLLLWMAPLFVVIAIAIKLTTPRLSVFYPWRVVGKNGVEFVGYKFTTMVADADERKESLAAQNEMRGPVFKISKDPRVTPLGAFLRKFSLNELPQLWSVFKGDMSLVGPRPAFRHELARYELWHKRKLSIRPGITCLWQVRGRNKISDFDQWVRMDLEYIDNWSLWLDTKILFRTAWVVVRGTGS